MKCEMFVIGILGILTFVGYAKREIETRNETKILNKRLEHIQ